jgi:flagellin-like protein
MHITWLEKKGVSPVIAVVLMIAVAVAIAVIVYAWASGFTSGKTEVESGGVEQLILESQKLSGTALIVHIRNELNTAAVLDAVYHNGDLIAKDIVYPIYSVMPPVTELNLTDVSGGAFLAGDDVMLVTEEGTQIKFKVKG